MAQAVEMKENEEGIASPDDPQYLTIGDIQLQILTRIDNQYLYVCLSIFHPVTSLFS